MKRRVKKQWKRRLSELSEQVEIYYMLYVIQIKVLNSCIVNWCNTTIYSTILVD